MGGSVSLSSVKRNGDNNLIYKLSDDSTYNVYLNFPNVKNDSKSEEVPWDTYPTFCGSKEILTIFNYLGYLENKGFLTEKERYKILVKDTKQSCIGSIFLQGGIYDSSRSDNYPLSNYESHFYKGTIWMPTIDRAAYNMNQNPLNCCLGNAEDMELCNSNFTSGFKTDGCDYYMNNYCEDDKKGDKICLQWLAENIARLKKTAANSYANYCSTNLPSDECAIFVGLAKDSIYHKNLVNNCITTYCGNNLNNPNCDCLNKNPSVETIAPKECIYNSCTVNLLDGRYITTDQEEIKKDCNIVVCELSIEKLSLTGSDLLINNSCSGTNKTSVISTYDGSFLDDVLVFENNDGLFIYPLLIIICTLLLSLITKSFLLIAVVFFILYLSFR